MADATETKESASLTFPDAVVMTVDLAEWSVTESKFLADGMVWIENETHCGMCRTADNVAVVHPRFDPFKFELPMLDDPPVFNRRRRIYG